jgi:uncharacterized protein YjbI with pentapeptide repeats
MSTNNFLNETFERIDFHTTPFIAGEYEGCCFVGCDLSEANLGDTKFLECEFRDCNMSMAKLSGTVLCDVRFSGCKMLGVQFGYCNGLAFSPQFDNCILDHSSFFERKMTSCTLRGNSFRETDFTDADFSGTLFDNCDLDRAIFDNTNLECADFRTSRNFSIDPTTNRIKKAKFTLTALPGLLRKYKLIIDNEVR